MSESISPTSSTPEGRASLGHSHGYRFEGDTAFLNAELAIPATLHDDALDWALQLWACDAPYGGGPLHGIKVAEAQLALPPAHAQERPQLTAEAFAHLPPGQRSYTMVMVLAAGARGVYDQVHDFCNYPARQEFSAPHFEGSVGYRIEEGAIVLSAERVKNPRPIGNVSGTLALELWALSAPYTGGDVAGSLLAHVELDRLFGQSSHEDVARRVTLAEPPAGAWYLTLMLREWTAASTFLTRDYCTFATPYVGAAQAEVPQVVPTTPVAQGPAGGDHAPIDADGPSPAALEATSAAKPSPSSRRADAPSEQLVSVGRASIAQLLTVPGLNRKLAGAIVRGRPYRSLDELTRIRGIGDRLLPKLKRHLSL